MHVCMYVCMYVCMDGCMCVCVCVRVWLQCVYFYKISKCIASVLLPNYLKVSAGKRTILCDFKESDVFV